ncbi:MAG: DUF4238 domain-containing protein [Acidobacteria bacterium]|nr:DUF4238 domain-containing protein [Acidobacteriota bacterium]
MIDELHSQGYHARKPVTDFGRMPVMTARIQHTVPQWYMKNWGDEKDRVVFSRNGEAHGPTNPKNILAKRDFYESPVLTVQDIAILSTFVAEHVKSENARPMAEAILEGALFHSTLKTLVLPSPHLSEDEKKLLSGALKGHEERRLSKSEDRAKDVVDRLLEGDADVLLDSKSALNFFEFLGDMKFRGRGTRAQIAQLGSLSEGGAAILAGIVGANMTCVHFLDRLGHPVTILRNETDRRFVTSDNPVVNILGPQEERVPDDDEYALYFPLSPSRALIVPPWKQRFTSETATEELVASLNAWIASNAHETLIAQRREDLTAALKNTGAPPPMRIWFEQCSSGWRPRVQRTS